ncbi:GxxExxY protein [Candidatus Falkowbacteria bacterium CG10_big_fil_rev_8_21_14_0_10_44_15]|uniref:GxxExxY protein n=1 Tax=Candidatus Falkowbacteria bacterium CG10_big_fil_rev_8_21_14_0_10_44_15 TaxID=1974569 RepID=A0A2H0UZ41_9BACT|nr:MAG: GxxExxY protein [Candidatus Falkowbacteria bacterium CG10_big_fil_rev_8_21_14_0_10_44_15]
MEEDKCIYKELSYEIVGLFFQVHKDLGRFRSEKQYGDYFKKLLQQKNLKYIREYRFNDHQYGKGDVRCIVDFIIEDKIIVEFKTRDSLTKEDYYQVKRYLVTLNLHLGILVNFRQPRLVPKRILNGLYYKKA